MNVGEAFVRPVPAPALTAEQVAEHRRNLDLCGPFKDDYLLAYIAGSVEPSSVEVFGKAGTIERIRQIIALRVEK